MNKKLIHNTDYYFIVYKSLTIIAISLIILSHPSYTYSASDNLNRLCKNIDQMLLDKRLKNAKVGIKIKSLKTNEILYDLNANKLFNPASNMKLITSAAAFFYLKPEYTFKTEICYDGKIKSDKLSGNIFIKGGGDPALVSEQLWDIAQRIANKGIKVITGDLIGDDSFFDKKRICDSWEDVDGQKWYNPRIGDLSLNFNTVFIYVKPGIELGAPLQVSLNPASEFIKIMNNGITGYKKRLNVERFILDKQNYIRINGHLSPKHREITYIRNIEYPPMYTLTVFKELLTGCGIDLRGDIKQGLTPETTQNLITHESRPLSTIISSMNKISSNFIAEQILKILSTEIYGPPGNTCNGLKVLNSFLEEELKKDPSKYKIVDGSGLSSDNRLSPELIIDLLEYIYQHFEFKYEFISSLSISGTDGTMSERLIDTSAQRKIRAKSGRLKGTSTLSGYAITKDNEELIFSIFVNEAKTNIERIKDWQDKLVLLLTSFSR